MLKLDQWMDIKLLKKEGHSIRQIARMLGMSRNTVRRALRRGQPPKFATPAKESKLDGFKEYVRQRYESCGGLSAVRLLEEIRAQGYEGSVQTLRRFVTKLAAPRKATAKLTVRYETAPGQQAQCDWSYCGRFSDAAGR